MYKNKFKTGSNNIAEQAITHDGWVNKNLLKAFANIISEVEDSSYSKEPEQVAMHRQQSWIPWPSFRQ